MILFDIDRTLIKNPENNRFTEAINNLHDLGAELKLDPQGLTDKLILAAILEQEGWSDEEIEKAMPKLTREVDRVHAQSFQKSAIEVLPGVRELLDTLKSKGVNLGLITGNLETVAKRKLTAVGLWQYFSLGGFASDPHVTRADLINIAIDKAGFNGAKNSVYVVGDTPRDIFAAKDAKILNSVGVANGYRPVQELIDAGAKIVLKDFKNTSLVVRKLGLE